jgi:hypothetical protein
MSVWANVVSNMDSPLYRLGYSKKGWTDGEIGVEWIKIFDEQTQEKANGCHRLLLVDGYNSHYTLRFLEYAAAHNIHILCHPAHATHVYQGLDVAVFGVLKVYWTEERDKHECETWQKVTKENFLAIYGRAHVRALTEETIRSAFRKTGVVPFDRNIVTQVMMAPSLETSSYGNMPLLQPSPVRRMAAVMRELIAPPPGRDDWDMNIDDPGSPMDVDEPDFPGPGTMSDPFLALNVQSALMELGSSSSSASFLFSSNPVQSSSQPPTFTSVTITPSKKRYASLLNFEPLTE